MSLPPAKARLQEVLKLQSKIFHQTYNPTKIRTGSKYLTQKLKGDTIKDYYGPTEFLKMKDLRRMFPLYDFVDPAEEYRLDILKSRKRRGKGAPTKIREAPSDNKKKKK
jgi:small subunit ribosomal protein S33